MKKFLAISILGLCAAQIVQAQTPWITTGNAALSSDFLGTINNVPLIFKVNNLRAGIIDPSMGNTSLGMQALTSNTGAYNLALGNYAMYSNVNGANNTAGGSLAMYSNTSGDNNTAYGANTLYANNGNNNTGIGIDALEYNTADNNTAVGASALSRNTSGSANTATGENSLTQNTTGNYNTATGNDVLWANNGSYNTATGVFAQFSNTTGSYNTVAGYAALNTNTTGVNNTANGYEALYSNTASSNTAFGYEGLFANTTGTGNTACGNLALKSNTTSMGNTAVGDHALSSSTGYYNTSTGASALGNNTSGGYNTANGYNASYSNTTGNFNVAYGNSALSYQTTGSENVGLGYGAYPTSSTAISNWMGLGYNIGGGASASNMVELGNSSVTSIRVQVAPTVVSDARIKDNVKANVPGLDFINRLRPVTYNLNIHRQNEMIYKDKKEAQADWDGKYDIEKITQTGFLAQEVEKAANDAGYNFSGVEKPATPGGLYGVRYSDFVMPLVKSVQELSATEEDLKKQNAALQAQVSDLKTMVLDMQKAMLQCCSAYQATKTSFISSDGSQAVLQQNVPNPFGSSTVISCTIPGSFQVAEVKVFNIMGNEMMSFPVQQTGISSFTINGNSLAAGMYQYSLFVDGNMVDTKKMVLTK